MILRDDIGNDFIARVAKRNGLTPEALRIRIGCHSAGCICGGAGLLGAGDDVRKSGLWRAADPVPTYRPAVGRVGAWEPAPVRWTPFLRVCLVVLVLMFGFIGAALCGLLGGE